MSKNPNKIIIYTDGGSRGNPGPSAIGVIVGGKQYAEQIGIKTNNEAEYEAVIFALKKTKSLLGKKALKETEVELKSDSELLIKQLNGQYKIVDEKIQPLFLKAWNLRIDFGKLKFSLIPRGKNKLADKLVNQVLDNQTRNQTLF
jgi:ribonuclease HI